MSDQNPACKHLDKVHFDNPAHLVRVLNQDKHTRVEGLCSEAAFMEDIVQGNFEPVTTDFWFSLIKGGRGYHIRKVLTDLLFNLSELDYYILDYFTGIEPSLPVSIVYFNEFDRTFHEVEHKKGVRYSKFKGLGEMINQVLNPLIAEQSLRNEERIKKGVII